MKETNAYNDIIHLPHPQSKERPHMSNYDRAAQFSPFAALKGYDDGIEEAARFTEEQTELDESRIEAINEALLCIKAAEGAHPCVRVTYFRADERKAGGAYRTTEGTVKKIDERARRILFEDGEAVPFRDLVEIERIS